MNDWLFPLTIWLTGCVVWIIANSFVREQQKRFIVMISGGLGALLGVAIFFYRQYHGTGGVLLCVTLFLVVFHIGFGIPWSKKSAPEGPFALYFEKEAVVVAPLMPKGKIEVEGNTIAATSEGLFLAQGEKVKIIRCGERMVVVRKIEG